MIFCLPSESFPTGEGVIEELTYKDENGFEWLIARVENGFMVKYLGDKYFQENRFQCILPDDTIIPIKNTNCLFFQTIDFDVFCQIRDIIKKGFTDDIWEEFEDLFVERLKKDPHLLESETII